MCCCYVIVVCKCFVDLNVVFVMEVVLVVFEVVWDILFVIGDMWVMIFE